MTTVQERRKTVLTEDDWERMGDVVESRIVKLGESIGHDYRTPESRTAIRDDNQFLRTWRTNAEGAAKRAFYAILATIGGIIAYLFAKGLGLGKVIGAAGLWWRV